LCCNRAGLCDPVYAGLSSSTCRLGGDVGSKPCARRASSDHATTKLWLSRAESFACIPLKNSDISRASNDPRASLAICATSSSGCPTAHPACGMRGRCRGGGVGTLGSCASKPVGSVLRAALTTPLKRPCLSESKNLTRTGMSLGASHETRYTYTVERIATLAATTPRSALSCTHQNTASPLAEGVWFNRSFDLWRHWLWGCCSLPALGPGLLLLSLDSPRAHFGHTRDPL
jgi:hypothetical protein